MGRRTSSPACFLQTTQQSGVSLPRLVIPDGEPQGLFLADHYKQPLGACNSGVDEVPLEEHVMLHGHRDNHRWELRALRLVDGHRVSQRDFVQFPVVINNQPVIEPYRDFLLDGIDLLDHADVPVEHFLLVVVLSLDDLVSDLEPPAESLRGGLTGTNRVESPLKHRVQLADSDRASRACKVVGWRKLWV